MDTNFNFFQGLGLFMCIGGLVLLALGAFALSRLFGRRKDSNLNRGDTQNPNDPAAWQQQGSERPRYDSDQVQSRGGFGSPTGSTTGRPSGTTAGRSSGVLGGRTISRAPGGVFGGSSTSGRPDRLSALRRQRGGFNPPSSPPPSDRDDDNVTSSGGFGGKR